MSFLSNTQNENKPEGGSSYRRGAQICADSDALPERCMPIPDGNVVYEVSWKKGVGMVCVGNACQGSPQQPPQPTPPPYNPPNPTPPPGGGSGGSTGSNGLLPDNQPLPGGVADEKLIKALYQGILYASPDPAGLAYWKQLIEADGTWLGYKKVALQFAAIFEQQHMFNQHSSIQVLDRLWQTFVTSGGCADESPWFQSTFLSLMNQGDLEEPLRRILNESYFNKPLVQQGPPAQYRVCH